jgi:ribA/ribD-fused uncharacterized protein
MAAANDDAISNKSYPLQHLDESSSVLSAPCSKKRDNDAISDSWGAYIAPSPSVANARTIYFHGEKHHRFGCFSNWSKHGFAYKGISFVSSEQAFMWEKAMTFGDHFMGAQIMAQQEPSKIKTLGRSIKNFKEDVWALHRYNIMVDILTAKFGQNQAIQAILLGTGAAELAEASSRDQIWGIGFTAASAEANRGRWHLNLLGKALVEVRVRLGGHEAVAVYVVAAPAAAEAAASIYDPENMCVHCEVQPKLKYPGFGFCGRTCGRAYKAKWRRIMRKRAEEEEEDAYLAHWYT